MTAQPLIEERRCKRQFSHLPHTWVDDADARSCTDYRCNGVLQGPPSVLDPWRQVPGRVGRIRTMQPLDVYADAERAAGQAKASRLIAAGQPRHALLTLIRTVEAQARIEGIGGIRLPYRLDAVTR